MEPRSRRSSRQDAVKCLLFHIRLLCLRHLIQMFHVVAFFLTSSAHHRRLPLDKKTVLLVDPGGTDEELMEYLKNKNAERLEIMLKNFSTVLCKIIYVTIFIQGSYIRKGIHSLLGYRRPS